MYVSSLHIRLQVFLYSVLCTALRIRGCVKNQNTLTAERLWRNTGKKRPACSRIDWQSSMRLHFRNIRWDLYEQPVSDVFLDNSRCCRFYFKKNVLLTLCTTISKVISWCSPTDSTSIQHFQIDCPHGGDGWFAWFNHFWRDIVWGGFSGLSFQMRWYFFCLSTMSDHLSHA